jgi:peptidoglycan/LPS O-acetylase OafA/YrhL
MGEDGFTLGRRPALDGLRGIAVLLVIIGHETRSVTGAAWAGVTIFFVLSGFLITRLLLEEHRETGRIDRTAFYTRRARRLLPALALLLLYFAMAALTGKYPWQPIAFAVTLTANLAATFGVILGGLGHTWSLALEEQFYALWPFALIPLARHRHGSKILIMAALGSAALRIALIHDDPTGQLYGFRTDTRADAIIIGCLLALNIDRVHRLPRLPLLAAAAALIATLCCLLNGWTATSWIITPVALSAAVVIAWAVRPGPVPGSRALANPPLRGTGRISYGMYLWQEPIIVMATALPLVERVPVTLAATYAAALASWLIVERPFMRRSPARPMRTAGLTVPRQPLTVSPPAE